MLNPRGVGRPAPRATEWGRAPHLLWGGKCTEITWNPLPGRVSPGIPFRGERPLGPPSGGSCRCSRVDSFVRFRALAVRSHVFPEHPGCGLSHSSCCRYAQITPLWPVGGFQRLRGRPPRAQAARAVPSPSVSLFPGTARCSGPRVHVPPTLYTRPRLQGAAATFMRKVLKNEDPRTGGARRCWAVAARRRRRWSTRRVWHPAPGRLHENVLRRPSALPETNASVPTLPRL